MFHEQRSDATLLGNSLKGDFRLAETVARNAHPLQHCEMQLQHRSPAKQHLIIKKAP